jgi:hypothetical protein
MVRPIIRPDRRVFPAEISGYDALNRLRCRGDADSNSELAVRELTDEEARLVGYGRNFLGVRGEPMYMRVPANRGSQLRRIGAADHCIVCGMPALPGVTPFAHIHMRDLHLSPHQHATRVFCLCWHHHHGCYDQGYISTLDLLRAEEVWIENRGGPNRIPATLL